MEQNKSNFDKFLGMKRTTKKKPGFSEFMTFRALLGVPIISALYYIVNVLLIAFPFVFTGLLGLIFRIGISVEVFILGLYLTVVLFLSIRVSFESRIVKFLHYEKACSIDKKLDLLISSQTNVEKETTVE